MLQLDVDIIMGNDLAGGTVWASVPPSVVVSGLLAPGRLYDSDWLFEDIFPVCTATRTQSCEVLSPYGTPDGTQGVVVVNVWSHCLISRHL